MTGYEQGGGTLPEFEADCLARVAMPKREAASEQRCEAAVTANAGETPSVHIELTAPDTWDFTAIHDGIAGAIGQPVAHECLGQRAPAKHAFYDRPWADCPYGIDYDDLNPEAALRAGAADALLPVFAPDTDEFSPLQRLALALGGLAVAGLGFLGLALMGEHWGAALGLGGGCMLLSVLASVALLLDVVLHRLRGRD